MGTFYSAGLWTVKAGNEKAFIAAWREFAEWSFREIRGAKSATLLQDRANGRQFVSIGPWENLEAIEAWRSHPGFQQRLAAVRELVETLEPRTLEAVAEVS